ncbi:MAG: queA [Phycisphaerales bacterium]|nr:queA [Phycisphaerales bacterium]
MRTDDLDFHLPAELIAQDPPAQRTASRLLQYRRGERSIEHRTFAELPALLRAGDLLVFNDTRVLPARFMLRKPTSGLVEGLFLHETLPGHWHVLLKNLGRASAEPLHFVDAPNITATVVRTAEAGEHEIQLSTLEPAARLLERIGRMPLPPYIKRDKGHDPRDAADRARYQTVYANAPGAVAAPTAGLHFTEELLAELNARGIERTFVTLHVGMGTFKPVTADTLEAHAMHSEGYEITPTAADAINRAKAQGRRVIAVGTTSARVLESQPADEPIRAKQEATSIFIYPPYRWKSVDAMITNFHLPRSTLIALVAALVGLDEQRRIYREAIDREYRFFSYGDAMFIE